jgi:hypothetical protein
LRLWRKVDGALHDHPTNDERRGRIHDERSAAGAEHADRLSGSLERREHGRSGDRGAKGTRAGSALVRRTGRTGYFSEDAGRCLIYLITPPKSAAVFVETSRGRFAFTAFATGHVAANAALQESERLHLR